MLSLVIEIQSGLVSGALVYSHDREVLKTLYKVSIPITHKPHVSADNITKHMFMALAHVLHMVMDEGMKKVKENKITNTHIKSVHYIFSSPWVVARSKTIKIHHDNDVEISEKIIQDAIDAERHIMIKVHGEGLVFVEQKIFDIRLNGYSVQSYKGKKAKDWEVSFVLTLSADKIIKGINDAVSKSVHAPKEYFHSAILMQYISTRSLLGESDEYVIIHAHGEYTDLAVVKRGSSAHLSSLPYGITTLIRQISSATHHSLETSDSVISMYENDRLDESQKKKVEKVVTSAMREWQSQLLKSVEDIGKEVVLPRRIYLSSMGHFAIFKKHLEESGFEVSTLNDSLIDMYISVLPDMI